MQRLDDWNGCDGSPDGAHALVELVLDLVGADDGPVGAVVEHFFVRLLRTRRRLKSKTFISAERAGAANGPLHYSCAAVLRMQARAKHVDSSRMPFGPISVEERGDAIRKLTDLELNDPLL